MFAIFGIKENIKYKGSIITEKCVHCGKNSFSLGVRFKYFHIFWIPIIPFDKIRCISCDNCYEIFNYDVLSKSKKDSIDNSSIRNRIPFYYYIVIFSILVLILLGILEHN